MVSVIVPVYNSENYLVRCINSILSQTYTNFELILIDDGSTDSSGEICDQYLSDNRVRVIHKQNEGVSSARNMGMCEAVGEYMVFVDSDDYVEEDYLEKIITCGEYDFVTCYYMVDNSDSFVSVPFEDKEYATNDILDFIEENYKKLTYPVCRRYRSEIIKENRLQFNVEINYSEDLLFNLQYLSYVKSARTISASLYHYEKHEGSLSYRIIEWQDLNFTINMLGSAVEILYKGRDTAIVLNYFFWNLVRKYLTPIQFNGSFYQIIQQLKLINENNYVHNLFEGNSIITRSRFRRYFDYFMLKKIYFLASLLLKMEASLLKRGLIVRS